MAQAPKWKSPARVFYFLVLMQVLHSVEEISARLYIWMPRVTGRIRETFDFVPQLSLARASFIIANIVVIMLLLAVGAFLRGQRRWAWRVALVIGIIEILNGCAHIGGAIAIGGYFPGSASGVGLIIVGVMFLRSYGRHGRGVV